MFQPILKTLSDTEIVAVASELTNPDIKTESILAQLASKSDMSIEIIQNTMSDVRNTLIVDVMRELCVRLLECDKSV